MHQQLLDFTNLTTEKLESIHKTRVQTVIDINNYIANLDKTCVTYDNCFSIPLQMESVNVMEEALLDFEMLHGNKDIRDKTHELNIEFSNVCIEESMRTDVYEVIKHYYSNYYEFEKQCLSVEQIKYVENTMKSYRMIGLDLPEESRELIKELNKKISSNGAEYSKHLSDENSSIHFGLNDLQGMDEDWLSKRYNAETQDYVVKLQYPDFIPIMEYCTVRETRRVMSEHMGSRCVDVNLDILMNTVRLRKQKAEIFGFESHADYRLQNMMAKDSKTVMGFMDELKMLIQPLLKEDLDCLKSMRVDTGTGTDIGTSTESFESYDKPYYSRLYVEKESGINMSDLKKMFSIESVKNGIFEIYQHLLGLRFVDVTEDYSQALYAENVRLYAVYNSGDDSDSIGYFYLDLFPRDGKYSHAAMFTIISKSSTLKPLSAIVCNFDPDSNVEFDNVVTFFHEFGHLMHNTVSANTISALSGTKTQRDFVETPSQMFEEWCYCEEPLKKLVLEEYRDVVNQELVKKINKQNKLLQGLFNAGQLSYGYLDMAIHSSVIPDNTWEFYDGIVHELFGWHLSPKVNMLGNWSHMFGYDAMYYGYLWSKVYAIDLFSFFKENPMDKELGLRLRNEILSKGGALDGVEMLENFMGRKPNPNAYTEWLKS